MRCCRLCKRALEPLETTASSWAGRDGAEYAVYSYTRDSWGAEQLHQLGAGQLHQLEVEGVERCRVSQSYYQWVPFLLAFQGLLYLLPNKVAILTTLHGLYCVWYREGVAGSGGGEDGGDRGGRVQGLQGDQRGREGEGEGQHHQVHPRPEQDQWTQGR